MAQFDAAAGIVLRQDGPSTRVFNPRHAMPNLDPEWIVGWDRLGDHDDDVDSHHTIAAMTLALAAKDWTHRCYADYDAMAKELIAGDAEIAARIDAVPNVANTEQHLGALLDLRPLTFPLPDDMEGRMGDAWEGRLHTEVGGRFVLETAIANAFRSAHLEYVYAGEGLGPFGVPGLRARLSTDIERDRYCAQAYANGTSRTKKFALEKLYFRDTEGIVRLPVPASRIEAVKAAIETAIEEARAKIDMGHTNPPVFEGGNDLPSGLVSEIEDRYPITAIRMDGSVTVATIVAHGEVKTARDCTDLEWFIAEGKLSMVDICRAGTGAYKRTITVRFAELPTGVTLKVGDGIDFFGTVTAAKKKLDSRPSRVIAEEGYAFDASWLRARVRKGEPDQLFYQRDEDRIRAHAAATSTPSLKPPPHLHPR